MLFTCSSLFLSILLLLLSLFLFLSSFFCYSPCEPVATDLYLTFIKQEFRKQCFEAYHCYLPFLKLARVCYVYWLSKFVEYLDTVSKVDELPGSRRNTSCLCHESCLDLI